MCMKQLWWLPFFFCTDTKVNIWSQIARGSYTWPPHSTLHPYHVCAVPYLPPVTCSRVLLLQFTAPDLKWCCQELGELIIWVVLGGTLKHCPPCDLYAVCENSKTLIIWIGHNMITLWHAQLHTKYCWALSCKQEVVHCLWHMFWPRIICLCTKILSDLLCLLILSFEPPMLLYDNILSFGSVWYSMKMLNNIPLSLLICFDFFQGQPSTCVRLFLWGGHPQQVRWKTVDLTEVPRLVSKRGDPEDGATVHIPMRLRTVSLRFIFT